MKKSLSLAVIAAVFTAPAFAANLENPLYVPGQGGFYSKTGIGMMAKVTDDTDAQIKKGHDGETEFPIWRIYEDMGFGITDDLSVYGQVGYTYNGDIDRKGLHTGRLGLNYRILSDVNQLVWDVYADAHLGGLSKMTGVMADKGFKYDNYGTGQYGVYVGSKVGKTWDKLTGALYAELGHMLSNDNTEIEIDTLHVNPLVPTLTFTGTGVAKLKSFNDWNVGTKWAYEMDNEWTLGAGLAWKHHAAHIVQSAKIAGAANDPTATSTVIAGLKTQFKGYDFQDAFDEFPLTVSIANQLSESVQVAVYGEYTFDNGDSGSQNTTDVKAEAGVRVNVAF